MDAHVQLQEITGLHHLAPVLAAWHHAEWGHLYAPDVWDLATARREFEAMAEPGSRDRTWLAFDGDARDAEALLGSVSLVATDDLDGFEHLTPWLASMFVAPAARGRRVAASLTSALLDGARADGHDVVHLFTSGQRAFWAERGWSTVAEIDTEGHPATVMARRTDPRAARRAARSNWCSDPDHGGAYSYLRVAGTPAHRRRLAEEIAPGLWFAGEATSVEHPATMHGAWGSGERAATQVLAGPARSRVAVVGAGLAGITAARRLVDAGREVVVYESKPWVGGRIASDRSTGAALPLGGAWLHGDQGHPLRELVSSVPHDWDRPAFHAVGHGRLAAADVAEITEVYERLHAAFADAAPTATVAEVTTAVLSDPELRPIVREAVRSWITSECEGLYGAPMDDLAANGGFEQYELPGGDHLVTSDLGALAEQLADGLDVRLARRITEVRRDGDRWLVTTDGPAEDVETAETLETIDVVDAVIVTVPIGVLSSGRLRFSPPLPADVQEAVESIGAGPIAKVFATFDTVWWPADGPWRLVGTSTFGTVVDVSAAAGRPTLLGFAVGEAALRVEQMGEHELCRLFDHELASVGLLDGGADPAVVTVA